MVGLLYFLILIIIGLVTFGRNRIIDKENKINMRIKGTNLYRDHNMCPRDLKTNKKMIYGSNVTGDKVISELNGSNDINLSMAKRLNDITKAKANKNCEDFALLYERNNIIKNAHNSEHLVGHRYIGLDNDSIYVKRIYGNSEFWVDVNTKRAVRPTNMRRSLKNMNSIQKQKVDEYNLYLETTGNYNYGVPSSEH